MKSYVLVGGAWLGGWCWQAVAERMRQAGQRVYAATLTGLGERVHLANADVDLDTNITDVVKLIEFEDLQEVVLVGHSYAGIVVTGVADRIPERLAQVIYLDAGPAPSGTRFLEMSPTEYIARQTADAPENWRLPMPSWKELEQDFEASVDGLDAATREMIQARAVDQPLGTYRQPLVLTNPARATLSKCLISCGFPLEQVRAMIESGHPWFVEMAGPEWHFRYLPTSHWPMFSTPNELADLLSTLPATTTDED